MARHDVESEERATVWKVLKSVGDSVAEGDVIMILESMKMEIPVESPGMTRYRRSWLNLKSRLKKIKWSLLSRS